MTKHTEFTGRDDYLIAQALHVAIKALPMLPIDDRPTSNIEEMTRILFERYGDIATVSLMQDDIRRALDKLPEDASEGQRVAAAQAVINE